MAPRFRVYRSLEEIPPDFGPCVVTIGNFDGIHIGHREIFRRVVRIARENGWKASALTFHPHPAKVVAPDRAPRLLSTPEERCARMREEGIAQVVVLPFTPEFSCLSPEEFCREVLVERLLARVVLIGWNFRFGRGQLGDSEMLTALGQRYGFATEVVPGVTFRRRPVSSSEIRRLLQTGAVSAANRLLGRAYSLSGAVVPGMGIGSAKTVPTLNLRTGAEMLPATGVYVTRSADLDAGVDWPSVTNVGYRPTFRGENLSIESHLLAPLETETPRHIMISFLLRLREERKFPDAETLKRQILRDAARAKAYHRRVARWARGAARASEGTRGGV